MRREKLSIIKSVTKMIPIVFKQAPISIAVYGILVLLLAAQEGLSAPVNQLFYDSLTDAVLGRSGVAGAALCAGMVIGMILLRQILSACNSFLWQSLGDRLECGLLTEFHKKTAKLSAQSFENCAFLDILQKAQDGIYGTLGMFTVIFEIFFYFGGYFVITGLYLWHIQPVLLTTLFIVFIPSAVSVVMQSKLYAEEEDSLAILKRRYGSYYSAAVNPRETRLFGIFHHFNRLILETKEQIFAREYKTAKISGAVMLLLNLFKVFGWCAVAALLLRCLVKGEISVGAFAAVYYSIGGMFDNFEMLFSRIKSDISQNLGAINDYFAFLDFPVKESTDRAVNFEEGIHAENIRFKYPDSERWAVNGITLDINRGETVAVVGENGSGKTTLSKLLCGLYQPDDGRVTLGGLDTASASSEAIFGRTSAVFQNYVRYCPITLEENVKISRPERQCDADEYLDIAKADFYKNLPNGKNTVMSREFDGAELSGGQWQKVAMARGLYRNHDFIIFDEPTSAIDPLEETRIYNLFSEHSKDKTCILITHRLGSARIADRIIVMDDGRISEQGKHEELLASGGLYSKMWAAQSENYIAETPA